MANPQIVEGYRPSRDERDRAAKPVSGSRLIPEGKRAFQAVAARYRLQLTNPQDVILPDGRKIPGRPISVTFDENFKILDLKTDANLIELILESDAFKQGRVWDYSDVIERAKVGRVAAAVAVLQDPEDRAAIIEALKASGELDFVLPNADAGKPGKPAKAAKGVDAIAE